MEEIQRITKIAEEATEYRGSTNSQLWEESKSGMMRLIKLLGEMGVEGLFKEELFSLACERDAKAVASMLKGPASKHKTSMDKQLLVASSRGLVEVVKVLLQHGASVEITDLGWPLLSACCNGYIKVAKLLVESGSKVSPSPLPPLIISVMTKLIFIVVQIQDTSCYSQFQPIHYLCHHNDPEAQDLLVDIIMKGAKVNLFGESSKPPLQIAMELGYETLLNLLFLLADEQYPAIRGW